jgi:cell division protein FtsB
MRLGSIEMLKSQLAEARRKIQRLESEREALNAEIARLRELVARQGEGPGCR